MLLTQIQSDLIKAMKQGETIRKSILRMVIGEAGLTNSIHDEDISRIMRKLIERNKETMAFMKDKDGVQFQTLEAEIQVLEGFLPRMLHNQEIRSSLLAIRDDLRACPKEGAAIGMAMKRLKEKGDATQLDGKDVREVVLELRREVGELP